MKELKKDELYFANTIDGLVEVDDIYSFVAANKKLIALHNQLMKYGIMCEYEYAFHENDDIIPALYFDRTMDDGISDPGLPGIAVISRNNQLILVATPDFTGIYEAIEFEDFTSDKISEIEFTEPDDQETYFDEIFATDSVKSMMTYITTLSMLQFQTGGYIIPLSREYIVIYWTRIMRDWNLSYERTLIYKIISDLNEDGDFNSEEVCYVPEHEECQLAKQLTILRKLIEYVRSQYEELIL